MNVGEQTSRILWVFLTLRTASRFRPLPLVLAALIVTLGATSSMLQGGSANYTVYFGENRRTVIVRTQSNQNTIALDQLAGMFGLTFSEDKSAGGLIIGTRGDRILALADQSFVRTAGRVITLDGPIRRDRGGWIAPIDFLTKALAAAIGEPIVVRPQSRIIVVGNVRVPVVSAKIERSGPGARVVISLQPHSPYRVTREGDRLLVRFDATALDLGPISGFIQELVHSARVDGTTLMFDLGPSIVNHRVADDRAAGTVIVDLLPANAPPPPPPTAPVPPPGTPQQPASPLARFDQPSGGVDTIVIDAGHGGEDNGAVGAGGLKEKDFTLLIARRVKAVLEGRLGIRVLLTRDSDENIPIDRRTELANHQKADLLLSLHANWSVRPAARGVQIYTLGLDAYRDRIKTTGGSKLSVPILGGGARVIEPVPWDLAQVPFAPESAALGGVFVRHFTERNVPLFVHPTVEAPMRVLIGAHMPAVLIELGFLSNPDDERALGEAEWQNLLVESIVAAITEARRGGGGQ